MPSSGRANVTEPSVTFDANDWNVPKAVRVISKSDGNVSPSGRSVEMQVSISTFGTTDSTYATLGSSMSAPMV